MNIHISQTINIRFINITSITNSSMLQIGTTGQVEQSSYLLNTGGFTQQAPAATDETVTVEASPTPPFLIPLPQ
ncbi:spore germination protein GerPB [Bacillus sp. REN10]|uniref:spore germination protein GerPB n=1 Tax=Bacillus sp. REN10 TaxID=2782541 RepID=UPI00193B2A4C|nr:spore germination protein GerPB [Bacillus sp. REN10]